MINKNIRKHSIIETKRITLEYATLDVIRLTVWNMVKNHGWNIVETRMENLGFGMDLVLMYRCEIDYTI